MQEEEDDGGKRSRLSELVKRIRELDTERKGLEPNKTVKENVVHIQGIYSAMQHLYAVVILDFYDIVPNHYKSWDVHNTLWKTCFYNPIEDFRSSIKECHSLTKKFLRKDDQNENASALDKVQHRLLRLVTSFSKFLNESSTYYQDLMLKLESHLSAPKNLCEKNKSELQRHIYRCLLYLGDLARYSEQNTDRKEKDFGIAQRYYERAAFVAPESGNPHNQLAVLAGYNSAECVAVFYYFRSILAKNPFTGGYENLDILFRKVAKQYDAWYQSSQESMESGIVDHGSSSNNNTGTKAREFLLRFTHLHGQLFTWAQDTYRSEGCDLDAGQYNPPHENEWSASRILHDAKRLFGQFEELLASAVYSDSLLTKMLIICISSVHLSVPPSTLTEEVGKKGGKGGSRGKNGTPSHRNKPRVTGESAALIVLYEYARCMANRVTTLVQNASTNNSVGNNNKKGGNSGYRLMPVLSVLCDWLEVHAEYLLSCQASLNGQGDEDVLLYSNKGLIDAEGQSRSAMRQSLLRVVDAFEAQSSSSAKSLWQPPTARSSAGDASKPLREHIELRGYVPILESYEYYFGQQKPDLTSPSVIPSHVTEEAARDRRVKRLLWFVKQHVAPCAKREAKEAEGRRLAAVKDREQEDRRKDKRYGGAGVSVPELIMGSHTQTNSGPSSFAYSAGSNTLAVESTGDGYGVPGGTAQTLDTAVSLEPGDGDEDSLGEEVVFQPGFAPSTPPSKAPLSESSEVDDDQAEAGTEVAMAVEGDRSDVNFLSGFSHWSRGLPRNAMEAESEGNGRSSPWWDSHHCQDPTSAPLGSGIGWVEDGPPGLVGGVPPGLFGGLESSSQGLSLLQRIHDASLQGDVGVDQFGELILPPPGPPPASGPPAEPYTANPFFHED